MTELLPCPFCGSDDIDPEGVSSFKPEFRTPDNNWKDHATPDKIEHRPACNNCNATTDNDWNERNSNQQIIADLIKSVQSLMMVNANLKWGEPYPGRNHAVEDAAEKALAKATHSANKEI